MGGHAFHQRPDGVNAHGVVDIVSGRFAVCDLIFPFCRLIAGGIDLWKMHWRNILDSNRFTWGIEMTCAWASTLSPGDRSPLTVHGYYRLYSLSSPARPHKISHVPRLDRWSVVGSDNATHCGSHHRPLAIEVGETSTVHDRWFRSCRDLLTGLGVDFRNSWNVRPGCRDGRWGNSISQSVFYKGTVRWWSLASDRDMAIAKVAGLTDWIALEKTCYHCCCGCKYLRGRLRD